MSTSFNVQRLLATFEMIQCACAGSMSVLTLEQRLQIFDVVESTNQTAWHLMVTDDILEPIVIALRQTIGRGQRGRQWYSERGGLYLSVGLRVQLSPSQATQLTLATAWGVATALRQLPARLRGEEQEIPVQLKWLNDLVLEGYKLGGILTETRSQQECITRSVIGVGINWTNPVPPTGVNLQPFLARYSVPLIESLEGLTAIVLHGIFSGIQQQQSGNIDRILSAYVNLLAHRDRPIWFEGDEWMIKGITATGALRVQRKSIANNEKSRNELNFSIEKLIHPGTINLGYPLLL